MTSVILAHTAHPFDYYPLSSPFCSPLSMSTLGKTPSHEGYSSAESESTKKIAGPAQPGAKRRPSRAGTRSVNTLTPGMSALLESLPSSV
jgi:hypothetical protein